MKPKSQKEKNGFVYRIAEWQRRYEITTKQTKASDDTPAEHLRKKPHEFIRWKVFGHNLGPGYRRIVKKAWRQGSLNELAIIGLFGKLLEIAGDQAQPAFRGWILDHDQQPMDHNSIAELLDIEEKGLLKDAIAVLVDVGWVELLTFRQFQKLSETFGKIPTSVPKNSDALSKSKQKKDKYNINQKDSEGSGKPQTANNKTFLFLALSAFGDHTKAEKTTFSRLGNRLAEFQDQDPYIFDKAIAQVERCRQAKKPKAYFTTLVNEIIKSKQ